jgi:hypothetical protein
MSFATPLDQLNLNSNSNMPGSHGGAMAGPPGGMGIGMDQYGGGAGMGNGGNYEDGSGSNLVSSILNDLNQNEQQQQQQYDPQYQQMMQQQMYEQQQQQNGQMGQEQQGQQGQPMPPMVNNSSVNMSIADQVITESKEPLLVSGIFFLLSMPFFSKTIGSYLPSMINGETGELNTMGMIILALFAGVLFFFGKRLVRKV